MPIIRIIKKYINKIRKSFYKKKITRIAKRVGHGLKVNGKSSVTSQTILGNNVNFNGMIITGKGCVTIGDNFHSGIECMMITHIHNYDKGFAIPYDNTYIYKNIVIKDNVWLGSRVIILGGVTIGEGAIIQAGSVVVNNIPDYAIAGGSPAIVFKYRDVDHYNELKKLNKFN